MAARHHYLVAPLVGTGKTHDSFTYHGDEVLRPGQLIKVPLGKRSVYGVVLKVVTKPKFKTRPVEKAVDLPPLPTQLLALALWIKAYYAAPLPQVLQTMLPTRPQVVSKQTKLKKSRPLGQITLNQAQTQAVAAIQKSRRACLLHGVTGSGKTHVYIELAKRTLLEGKSSLVLVPEISLTPQAATQFERVFGNRVIVTHSGLKDTERRQLYQRALKSPEPLIVIGPRSALFMPVPSLGLIVIDESHETSYKQDQSPRYHGVMVGAKLAQLSGAQLVLGSATPAINDIFLVKENRLKLIELPKPVHSVETVAPEIVDMRERSNHTKGSYISKALLLALKETFSAGRQSLLFINRRGSARVALCSDCSWAATCPRCAIPLTFHAHQGTLLCHWCDHRANPPSRCPECGGSDISYLGAGSQRIEQEISRLLPGARIARLDRDSADRRAPGELLTQLNQGEIDILVGTQMVAKGLDIPSIETVGVISADSHLYMPDFSANERTFQLLYQVSGRAGRRKGVKNRTVIQTYSPDHPTVLAGAKRDFWGFMEPELAERKLLNYPPYVYLLKLTTRRKTRAGAQKAAQKLATEIEAKHPKTKVKYELIGPAPAFRETLRGQYYWQLIIKSRERQLLAQIAWEVPGDWTHDLDPLDLL